ncbi:MAG TPA: hypothetical protein VNO86_00485, partial [Candidatus Binatia bacterium]|nr:hypothetical protein [Candidatus Binatia bacterium]
MAGTLAGQARIELPAGSVPLAAHAGRVAAVENAGAGRQARSTVSISAIGGSATTVSVTLDAFVNFGIFVGSELIVTGESADDRMAPAVVAIDVETGARRTILPEAPVPEGWNGITPARTLAASASGRTLVAGLCSYGRETCQATIVELPGGTVRGSFALPGFLRPGGFGGATDDLLIFGVGETKIGAAELRSGEVLWRQTADGFYGGYL